MRTNGRVWLFDLDNTLHDADPHIFPHINRSMTGYLMQHLALDEAAANRLRVDYWRRYGATLLGLVRHHAVSAAHFLEDTHRLPGLEPTVRGHRHDMAALARLPRRHPVLRGLLVLVARETAQHGIQFLLQAKAVPAEAAVLIAVLGLTTDDTRKMVDPANVEGVEFRRPAAEAATLLPELKGKLDGTSLRVPVPVRSVLGVPWVYTWRMKSSYWERTGRVTA